MSCKKCKTNKCTCEVTTCINPLIYLFKGIFSLEGTDSNNTVILEILAKIIKENGKAVSPRSFDVIAKDALTETIDKTAAVEANYFTKSERFILDLSLALIETLYGGVSISNNKNLCCPDCKNGIYYLGSAENFVLLNEVIAQSNTRICCLEHSTSVETWLKVLESIGSDIQCCNTDFAESLELWINASSSSSANFYLDDLINLGVLESSSFNGYSGLGILFNYLQLNHPELTPEDYLNILGVIVNLGLVIQCDGCEIIMASTETYLKWWEANNNAPVPA